MVIGRPTVAGMISVLLTDNELIPLNLNSPRVVVFRQGNTTGRELKIVKPLGIVLASNDPLLRPLAKPECNYTLDPETQTGPLHQHEDGTWWFYEATWNLEQGPFATYEDAEKALVVYCLDYQNNLTKSEESVTVVKDEAPKG